MYNKQILSLNFDTGAKYYGFYGVGIGANGLFNPITGEINKPLSSTFVVDKINFKVDERTTKRHARRNHDRKDFVVRAFKELTPCVFKEDFKKLDEYIQTRILELFYGLFKHRGFNYVNTPNIDTINEENQEKLSETIFSGVKNKKDIDDVINSQIDKALDDKDYDILQVLKEQKKLVVKANLEKQEDGFDNKQLQNYIDAVIKELENTNNKHRKRYQNDIKDLLNRFEDIQSNIDKLNLKNIKKEFKTGFSEIKNLYDFLNISKDELYNIICNLSNLQTRVFRQYFNGKSNATYDDEKLYKAIKDNVNYIPYKSDDELKNKKYMLELLGKDYLQNQALKFLKTCEPERSITPYESLVNKQGQICNALMLKKEALEQNNLENIFEIILNDEIFSGLKSDKEQKIEVLTQRYLDISKEYLPKGSLLYPRYLYLGKTALKQLKDELNEDKKSILNMIKNGFKQLSLNDKDYENLQKFAKEYYKEIELAKNGIILNDKLSVCTCKTPHKTNMILQDLNALLGYEFFKDKNSVERFKDHIKDQKIEKSLTEINKIYQANSNSFWYKIEKTLSKEKMLLSDDEFSKVQKYDEIFQKIIKHFELANELYTKLQTNEIYGKFNFILQIFNILLKPRSGFANYCKEHSKEVMFRLNGSKVAICQTLSKNSAREFNGGVEKLLDIVAYNVVEHLSSKGIDFTKFDEIHINTEQNKFLFEQELKDMVNTRKNSNNAKKDEENLICAYEGVEFIKEQGEYDHIIPRSSHYGEFNQEANLILVSSEGNQNKKDKYKTLDELNENYLESIYKEINSILASISDKKSKEENVKIEQINKNNFKKFIKNNMPKMSEYRSYHSLSRLEQIAFRHALFLDGVSGYQDEFKKALELLKMSKVSSLVNGVQKRFVNLLHKKIKRKIIEKNLKSILNSDEFLDFLQKIKEFTKTSNHFPKNKKDFILNIVCNDEYLNELFTRPRKWSKSSKNHEFISEDIRNTLINLCSYIKNTYLKMDFETNSISSKTISDTRKAFTAKLINEEQKEQFVKLNKLKTQDELSHTIDASLVFYHTYNKYDFLGDVFNDDCEIVRLNSKSYEELKPKNQEGRVGLFKESIYSLSFDEIYTTKNKTELDFLSSIDISDIKNYKFNQHSRNIIDLSKDITSVVFAKIKGKKYYIYKDVDGFKYIENDKKVDEIEQIFIDTNLMLDIYFAKFKAQNTDFFKNKTLEKVFKQLSAYGREEIDKLFFDGVKLKKLEESKLPRKTRDFYLKLKCEYVNNKESFIVKKDPEEILCDDDKMQMLFASVWKNSSGDIYDEYLELKDKVFIQELINKLSVNATEEEVLEYIRKEYFGNISDIYTIYTLEKDEFNKLSKNKKLGNKLKKFYDNVQGKSLEKIKKDFAYMFYNKKELSKKKLEDFYNKFLKIKGGKRLRNFQKMVYSLKVKKSANIIIRRNNGFEGLNTNSSSGVKALPYKYENNELVVPFFNKNILPKKIENIQKLIKYQASKDRYEIYLPKYKIVNPIRKNDIKNFNNVNINPFNSIEIVYQEENRSYITLEINKAKASKIIKDSGYDEINFQNINSTNKLKLIVNGYINYDYFVFCECILLKEKYFGFKIYSEKNSTKFDFTKYKLANESNKKYQKEIEEFAIKEFRNRAVLCDKDNTFIISFIASRVCFSNIKNIKNIYKGTEC